MSKDIATILEGWDFEPDEIQVRIIPGLDGREKLQMRIDLGVLQMELDGRPDGQRPHGCESLLDHHEARAAKAAPDGYVLESADCAQLMREGLQYYHRYLALFHLQRFDLVARDTRRNLRLFAFVVEHAEHDWDKIQFDKYRPYVLMMLARSLGLEAVGRGDLREALKHIDEGIEAILAFLREYQRGDQEDQFQELAFLRRWRGEVVRSRKVGPVERLEDQLELAVAREDYEEAARLRDLIRQFASERGPGRAPDSNSFP